MTAFRGSSSQTALTNSDTTLSLPAASPAAQVGDTGLVWITGAVASAPQYQAPSGWAFVTATRVYDSGSPGVALEAWWKRLTSADLASSSWSWDPAHGVIVALTAYSPSSGKMVQPSEAASAAASTSSATRTTPSITTAGPRWLSTAYADRSGSTWTPGSGQTIRHDVNRGTGASSLLVTDSGGDLAAGTFTRTATASASTGTRCEGVVALEEVDAPATPDPEPEPDPGGSSSWLVVPSGFARIEFVSNANGAAARTTDFSSDDYNPDDYQ